MKGFADVHNHQFAYLGFGGMAFHGRAFGDPAEALPWCDFVPGTSLPRIPIHGSGGMLDILGNSARELVYGAGFPFPAILGHKVGGYPEFNGWPRWDNISHQAVHQDWLFRAVQGGLRLMVMLAVNNEFLCSKVNRVLSCDDMEAVDRQLAAAKEMEAHVDGMSGGPGRGWYRIVRSPQQARSVMEAGKLAVVLGVEVDFLFGSKSGRTLSEADVRRELDKYYDLGVRHIFPVHFSNNAFGGTAFQNASIASLSYPMRLSPQNPPDTIGAYMVQTEDGRPFGYEYRTGLRNTLGLTDVGKFMVREAMDRGMIIDVDHMSARSRADVLDIAEHLNCPVVSGHTGFIEISHDEKRHEGNLLAEEVDRIRRVGGMVSVILRQGKKKEIGTWHGPGQRVVEHSCGNTSETWVQAYLYAVAKTHGGPVGFGTDFNGFIPPTGPRFGPDACPGDDGTRKSIHRRQVPYPFTAAASGEWMPKSVVGRKTFDINFDGVAHIGLLPDFIADLEALGLAEEELAPLLHSAEGYVQVWEKACSHRGRSSAAIGSTSLLLLEDELPIRAVESTSQLLLTDEAPQMASSPLLLL